MNSNKIKIRALLKLGENKQDIAERLNCSYSTVIKEARALKREEENDVTKIDTDLLQYVIEETKETAPQSVVQSLETIEEGITGLQKLDERFHKTVTLMLDKADEYLKQEDLKIGEFSTVTGAVSNAYKSIFQSGGVNVNVNNGTQISDNKLSMFKNSMRQ